MNQPYGAVPNFVLASVAAVCLLSMSESYADQTLEPEDWYMNHYAPHWQESPWEKAEVAISFYHDEVLLHEPGMAPQRVFAQEWIGEALKGWQAEGWIGSTVPNIRTHRINESTAAFTTRWHDIYEDGSEEYSCAWYLADLIEGEWKFTQYATMDCAQHGFD